MMTRYTSKELADLARWAAKQEKAKVVGWTVVIGPGTNARLEVQLVRKDGTPLIHNIAI